MPTRREWLIKACTVSGVALTYALIPIPLSATPAEMREAMEKRFGNKAINEGRVSLTLPALAENGNSVRLLVDVDSPMIASDHVRYLHLFAEANPLPDIARFTFTPLSGRAHLETRIRVAQEQRIVAIAQTNDGALWSGSAHIVVTEAACIDALI